MKTAEKLLHVFREAAGALVCAGDRLNEFMMRPAEHFDDIYPEGRTAAEVLEQYGFDYVQTLPEGYADEAFMGVCMADGDERAVYDYDKMILSAIRAGAADDASAAEIVIEEDIADAGAIGRPVLVYRMGGLTGRRVREKIALVLSAYEGQSTDDQAKAVTKMLESEFIL